MPESSDPGVVPSVAAMMAADASSDFLGITVESARDGHATARMQITKDMVNGHQLAHGGLIFSLADTAFACACNSFGPVTVAAAAEITFVRPARLGDELVAVAARRIQYGRSGLYDVTVRCGGEVIAEFRGRSHQLADPVGTTGNGPNG
jgi:acyl-CoA thioesterase